MRSTILAAVALCVPLTALADSSVTSAPGKPVAPDAKLGKAVATKAIPSLGKAVIYLDSTQDRKYTLVVEAGTTKIASPEIALADDCGMHKCDVPGKVAASIKPVTVGGKPAAALELRVNYSHVVTNPDTGKSKKAASWVRTLLVVCNDKTCLQADFGTRDAPCTVSLSKTGDLTHSCKTTEALAF